MPIDCWPKEVKITSRENMLAEIVFPHITSSVGSPIIDVASMSSHYEI